MDTAATFNQLLNFWCDVNFAPHSVSQKSWVLHFSLKERHCYSKMKINTSMFYRSQLHIEVTIELSRPHCFESLRPFTIILRLVPEFTWHFQGTWNNYSSKTIEKCDHVWSLVVLMKPCVKLSNFPHSHWKTSSNCFFFESFAPGWGRWMDMKSRTLSKETQVYVQHFTV